MLWYLTELSPTPPTDTWSLSLSGAVLTMGECRCLGVTTLTMMSLGWSWISTGQCCTGPVLAAGAGVCCQLTVISRETRRHESQSNNFQQWDSQIFPVNDKTVEWRISVSMSASAASQYFLMTQSTRWRWSYSRVCEESAKMLFVATFVISTQAIVSSLASPIAVPAPFPGGKLFLLRNKYCCDSKIWTIQTHFTFAILSVSQRITFIFSDEKYLIKSNQIICTTLKYFCNNFADGLGNMLQWRAWITHYSFCLSTTYGGIKIIEKNWTGN